MRRVLGGLFLFVAMQSHAAGSIDLLCPNASAALGATRFPDKVPPDVNKGLVEVDFTVRVDGSVFHASIHSSTHPSFNEVAVEAVSKLSCAPQTADTRLRLPLDFLRPISVTAATCPNYHSVMSKLGYPRAAYEKGFSHGEVVIEFKLTAEGEIPEFYVMRTTHESFTAMALHGMAKLKCNGVGREVRVQVPFSFRL